jgi:lipoprotein-releasing system permease protein
MKTDVRSQKFDFRPPTSDFRINSHICYKPGQKLNFELFIAKRITLQSKRTFSRLIVAIAIGGITLGLAVMIVSLGIVSGFKSSIKDKIYGFAGHIQIRKLDLNHTPQGIPLLKDSSTTYFLDTFSSIKNYHAVATKVGIIKAKDQIGPIILKGIGTDFNWSFLEDKIIKGKKLNLADSSSKYQVLLSKYTAQRLNLDVNDDFLVYFAEKDLRVRKMKVAGIYDVGIEELDKLYLFCNINVIQKLNDWTENEIGGYEIFVKDIDQLESTTEIVNENIGMYSEARSIKDLYPQLFDWLELMNVNGTVIVVLMLLVAGINMISALLILILERTNTIGILKAIGASNLSIRKIFLYNSAYLILVGMFLGNLIGIMFCYLQDKYHLIKLDQQSYYVSYAPVDINWMTIFLLNAGTLLSCFLMIIIPSLLVTRITPMKAIRFK